jgi:hypothetical protein
MAILFKVLTLVEAGNMNSTGALLRYLTQMRIVFVADAPDVNTASDAMIVKTIEIETLFGVVD